MARDRAAARGNAGRLGWPPHVAHQRGEPALLAQEGGQEPWVRALVARCAPATAWSARGIPLRLPEPCQGGSLLGDRMPTTDLEDEGPGEASRAVRCASGRPAERKRRGLQRLGNGGAEGGVAGELANRPRRVRARWWRGAARSPGRHPGSHRARGATEPNVESVVLLSCFVPAHRTRDLGKGLSRRTPRRPRWCPRPSRGLVNQGPKHSPGRSIPLSTGRLRLLRPAGVHRHVAGKPTTNPAKSGSRPNLHERPRFRARAVAGGDPGPGGEHANNAEDPVGKIGPAQNARRADRPG